MNSPRTLRRMIKTRWLSAVAPLALVVASCGGGTPAEKIRPNAPTAGDALGEKTSGPGASGGGECREAEATGEPLIVDWKPEQRSDLEIVMKEAVAVVHYSCKGGFKLLKECKVDGKYGFIGMTKKEQVVRLTNADEVKANLPLAGAGIAGNIGAEMNRGATLDIAMVMVGKVKTTSAQISMDDLQGDCKDATHFVRGALVGAFAMETGTKAEAKAAAQIFGAGTSGASSSAKNVANKDGDISDCAKADPDSPKAPAQCRAMVRLELKAVGPSTKAAGAKPGEKPAAAPPPAEPSEAAAKVEAVAESSCPKGMVMAAGKCTAPTAEAPPFLCSIKDSKQCSEQCTKGHAGSCGLAGIQLANGSGGAKKDDNEARALLQKGCDGNDTKSCFNLGLMAMNGRGGGKDLALASKSWEKGCADADGDSCNLLGDTQREEPKQFALYSKGCEGGSDAACGKAGKMLLDGKGTSKDAAKGADFLKRACNGRVGSACADLGLMSETGKDAPKSAAIAKSLYFRGCILGNAEACVNQGRLELGQGGSQDNAKRAFESACTFKRHPVACAAMKVLYNGNQPFMPPVREAQDADRACSSGSARDCATAAAFKMANNQKAFGVPQAERACTAGDPFGCALKSKK